MSTTLNQNQFKLSPIKGGMDLRAGGSNVVSAVVKSTEATALVPGQAVVLYGTANGVPVVTAAAADTDDIFGFVMYNQKNVSFAGDVAVEIALVGAVMWMQASGTINWGDRLMAVISGQKVATRTVATKKTVIGFAYGYATDGNLLRVFIQTPSVFHGASITDLADTPSTLTSSYYLKANASGTAVVMSVS